VKNRSDLYACQFNYNIACQKKINCTKVYTEKLISIIVVLFSIYKCSWFYCSIMFTNHMAIVISNRQY